MQLIGMLDSPFVRRVAISLTLLELPYEHCSWSVGADFARIREVSALGRVPVLVLEQGEVLTDSAAILDYLDDSVGEARALLPRAGLARRTALRVIAHALGAADKGREQVYEQAMRPAERRHAPWVERVTLQMHGALAVVEAQAAARAGRPLVGEARTQADITAVCAFTFLCDTVLADSAARYPALCALAARWEADVAFRATRTPFLMPQR